MVTPGRRVVDVGCDHGFVSIYLVQRGISPQVLAMDVRTGPLSRAKEHIAEAGLGGYIETRLSDGLLAYQEGEADSLICAGMGGRLMMKILTESRGKARGLQELILQPQSELPAFRRFLREEGYQLLDENIIWEEGKYYFLMKVCPETDPEESEASKEDLELWDRYGKELLNSRHPVLKRYLEDALRTAEQIQETVLEKSRERSGERLGEIGAEIAWLNRALMFYGPGQ